MKVVVLLLACCFHQTSGVIHKLEYFYTSTSEISNFPEFVDVGVLDGVPISRYDSNTQRKVPLQKWMEESFDQQYWDESGERAKGSWQSFKVNMQALKERFNQTGGLHTFQLMYGCELVDDGTKRGYFQYGYDGEDFISLDKSTRTWTPANPKAVITKHKWEVNGAEANFQTQYLENGCIEWLGKYVEYGKKTLEREVPPEVSVLQKGSGVVCHATGFYPDRVMITWKRDGEEMEEDVDVGETLPNQDGTFQKRAVLTVSPEEKETKGRYICEVAHKSGKVITVSLDEIMRKNPDSGSVPFGPIIGVIGLLVVIAIAIGGVIAWKKRGKPQNYTPASSDDKSSNNSSNQA